MYVCHCRAVTGRAVRAAIASGARSIDDITASCHAGRGCGGCRHMLQAYLDACLGRSGSANLADSTNHLAEDDDIDVVDVLDVSFFVNRLQLGLQSPPTA